MKGEKIMAVLKKEFIDRMAENGGITKKAAKQGLKFRRFNVLQGIMSTVRNSLMMMEKSCFL